MNFKLAKFFLYRILPIQISMQNKPLAGPDGTKTGPGLGNILKNIFVLGWDEEFYFRLVWVGYFMRHFSSDFRDKL